MPTDPELLLPGLSQALGNTGYGSGGLEQRLDDIVEIATVSVLSAPICIGGKGSET